MDLLNWIKENHEPLLQLLGLVLGTGGILEIIVRLTPTKADDGFMTRIGKKVDHLLTALKVPNRLKDHEPID